MQVLSIEKYNRLQTAQWHKDCGKAHAENKRCLPQLAFYIFEKKNGFVAFEGSKALWNKTKKGVIAWWEEEETKKKIRGW